MRLREHGRGCVTPPGTFADDIGVVSVDANARSREIGATDPIIAAVFVKPLEIGHLLIQPSNPKIVLASAIVNQPSM
jgi:hypothetical protein